MPSLPDWLPGRTASAPVPGSSLSATTQYQPRLKDPNAPDYRLQITTKCIYERQLPGGSYITAHVERLQSGYYDSPVIHEDCIKNVRFVAIRFVFHEASTDRRFKSARIQIRVGDERRRPRGIPPLPPQIDHPVNKESTDEPSREKPKFLRHAPHLLYGSISPETLDWNFNLAGSLGVSQAPVTASINPSGGVKSSYKVYKMMKIQGSIRTNASWYGEEYSVEDGEIVWTLEENSLQKSGLPREFSFVMMLSKGDDANDVRFEVEIDPDIASWWGGHFPQWWVDTLKYQPFNKEPLNLDHEIGQKFQPCNSPWGFNFAGLMSTFDDFVTLPGTTWGTRDPTSAVGAITTTPGIANPPKQQAPALTKSPAPIDSGDKETASNTLHLRIHLDTNTSHKHGHAVSSGGPEAPSKSHRSPPKSNSTSTQAPRKADSTSKPPESSSAKIARRVTINGDTASNASKDSRPLSTHLEEPQQPVATPKHTAPSDEDQPGGYDYSFPERLNKTQPPVSTSPPSVSRHRSTKSTSTFPSSVAVADASPDAASPHSATKSSHSHHSLRRTRSRSGLRTSSLHSDPEDEEAISAAMDMLSGSPPPPAPAPPASAPPAMMTASKDTFFAPPRTRAALADLLEVERAESARVERRNGNLNNTNYKPSRDASAERAPTSKYLASRSQDRERTRQHRYSMPTTGLENYRLDMDRSFNPHDGVNGSSAAGHPSWAGRSHDTNSNGGNGRSSLMIPVGPRADSGVGLSVATSGPNKPGQSQPSASKSPIPRAEDSAAMQTAYEYITT